jgi:DNA-binding Lrp family transcriptional regulator
MSQPNWYTVPSADRNARRMTIAHLIETIDQTAPETKTELAELVGLSEQYLSELLQELKRDGIVTKSYVVNDTALYANIDQVSGLAENGAATVLQSDRSHKLLELMGRLDSVTRSQYTAAHAAFAGTEPDEPAAKLEALANERYMAVFDELKSYTLATEWPSNRVAADLATIATNLEIVGDRACFIADVVATQETAVAGVVEESLLEIFDAGERINDHMSAVLFDADLDRYEQLRAEEDTLHRDLDELFELVTAYDAGVYADLVTITRALERAIFYWVHSAELAVRLHAGTQPDHIEISV